MATTASPPVTYCGGPETVATRRAASPPSVRPAAVGPATDPLLEHATVISARASSTAVIGVRADGARPERTGAVVSW